VSQKCRTERARKTLPVAASWSLNLCGVALTFAAMCAGCSKKEPPVAMSARADFPSPAADSGSACSDVGGELRVCWGTPSGNGAADIRAAARPTPAFPASALGFRCTGTGKERRCRDRALDVPPFRCSGNACRESHPRLPDDGEWECAAVAGAVMCHGGEAPAGIPRGSIDTGFSCGDRIVKAAKRGERVCVDFSPDFPEGTGRGLRCRYDAEQGLTRICESDPNAHVLGDACDPAHPCVDGASCVFERCVPGRPEPSCWVAADCDHGTCRFGTCTEDAP